ncbi:MAG TPA: tRNA pseudouridine(38-40) synthase TruA [Patescibacteria group bacterium]|jgi:tRNA pseudouridine38-40 synthase|nr:tRNA pseudouridine(38-40) synthase TruA [Patescibacteria group bacterium]
MTKYAAIIAYEGTAYYGWQAQPTVPSIESTLKEVFQKTVGTPFCLVAASRTDAGVHALGQVIMFKHTITMETERLKKILNDSLPQDILIKDLVYARTDFHPWYDVKEKEYEYYFSLIRPLPEKSKFVWYCRSLIHIERLKQALTLFLGTHSFAAFATVTKDQEINTIKTVHSIDCSYIPEYTYWKIKITAPSFLRHMIRRIVGAAIFMAQHQKLSLDFIAKTLAQKKRLIEFPTAPAQGLLLHSVTYHKGLE